MRPFHQSKRPDNKRYAVEVRRGIFFENLTYYFISQGGRKYAHTNSYNSAMTVIAQDDHLTAAAWAACDRMSETEPKNDFVYKQAQNALALGPSLPRLNKT